MWHQVNPAFCSNLVWGLVSVTEGRIFLCFARMENTKGKRNEEEMFENFSPFRSKSLPNLQKAENFKSNACLTGIFSCHIMVFYHTNVKWCGHWIMTSPFSKGINEGEKNIA